jgi:hypothetical protein
VAGLVADTAAETTRLLLHVLAMPDAGPPDVDTRRAVSLTGVSAIRVLLRREQPPHTNTLRYGPALDLADLDALNAFVGGAFQRNSQYGWRFLDAESELTDDWPDKVSLDLTGTRQTAPHSLFWFTECLGQDPDNAPYCVEGIIRFTDLAIERADGTPIPVPTFADDGCRWWEALHANDSRVSVTAQHDQPPSPPWPNEPSTWPWQSTIV